MTARGRRVLLTWGDATAAATTHGLLADGAVVDVITPEVCASLEDLVDRELVTWHARHATLADLTAADTVLNRPATVETPTRPEQGEVVLVGGGPGDPGLLTVAGLAALREADVVVTDRLAPLAVLAGLRPDVEVIDVAKVPGGRQTSQDRINDLLVTHAAAGRRVVRFKGGDGFVFGRGGEEVRACAAAGVAVRVIPGVSSSIAVPAHAGIPVTHRGLTQGFSVVSGHVPPGHPESTIDYVALARAGTTIVVLMGVRNLASICAALVDAGRDPQTPAAIVADGALPTQRTVVGDLATLADLAKAAEIGSPAVTVIGDVVGEALA